MKHINRDSDEAASIQTVTGWVSSKGRFWGNDERMARYDGATHQTCSENPEHGEFAINAYCRKCYDERVQAQYEALPKKEYDGTPVCTWRSDEYFFDPDSLRNWLYDNEIAPEDACLVFCRPVYAQPIDPNSYYSNDLPDDGEVSTRLSEAFDMLNEIIKTEPPLSWRPWIVAVVLPDGFMEGK